MDEFDDVREGELVRPDGRTVAWTEFGEKDWRPVVRFPGTPGSRWSIRGDRAPWAERRLRMITTERPGFGRSTRLPGRGFTEHADDVAEVLDHLAIERAHLFGGSGAAPHMLAFCAQHADRVHAATVLVGIAPLVEAEIGEMIPLNAAAFRAGAAGDRTEVENLLRPVHEIMREDPIAALTAVMESAPEDDQAVLAEPQFRAVTERSQREAHAQGVDGWVDENLAIAGPWDDIDLDEVLASITWYHAAGDRNSPLSAARRLVERLPDARLVEWPEDVGHLYGRHVEPEILDELLSRPT